MSQNTKKSFVQRVEKPFSIFGNNSANPREKRKKREDKPINVDFDSLFSENSSNSAPKVENETVASSRIAARNNKESNLSNNNQDDKADNFDWLFNSNSAAKNQSDAANSISSASTMPNESQIDDMSWLFAPSNEDNSKNTTADPKKNNTADHFTNAAPSEHNYSDSSFTKPANPTAPAASSAQKQLPPPEPKENHGNNNNGSGNDNNTNEGIKKTSAILAQIKRLPIIYLYLFAIIIFAMLLLEIAFDVYYFYNKNRFCHGSKTIMAKTYYGDALLIGLEEIKQGQPIVERGYIDPEITTLMYRLVRQGDTVVDVGAGFGYYTIYLSRLVGDLGQVYSFEARKNIFDLLDSSISINKIHNVKLFNKTLFSSHAKVLLDTENGHRGNFGSTRIVLDHNNKQEDKLLPAYTYTLDSVLHDQLNRINFININATNSEAEILVGATRIIANSPNVKIVTSWNGNINAEKRAYCKMLLDNLAKMGFRVWEIKQNKITEIKRKSDILKLNKTNLLIARNIDALQ